MRVCTQGSAGESTEVALLCANPRVTQHTEAVALHRSKGPSPGTGLAAQHVLPGHGSPGHRSRR